MAAMDNHQDFDPRMLVVFCATVGEVVGVTKTFNKCEGCGAYVH